MLQALEYRQSKKLLPVMTTGLHVQNNKAFSDHTRRVISYFTGKNREQRCSSEFGTEDDNLSNFIPGILLEPP